MPRFSSTLTPQFRLIWTAVTSFKTNYASLKKYSSAIPRVQSQLLSWRKKAISWFGPDLDKEDLLRNGKEAIESAKVAGVASGLDTKRLSQLLEEFRNAKVVAALDDAEKLDHASRGQILTILGRGHMSVARLCEEVQEQLDGFLTAVEAELVNESIKYGEDPLGEALGTLGSELSELLKALEGAEKL